MSVTAHRSAAPSSVPCLVLTVSDSRTKETDTSGQAIASMLEAAGHTVAARELVPDDPIKVADAIRGHLGRKNVCAVITTGGPGITSRARPYEAVSAPFATPLAGPRGFFPPGIRPGNSRMAAAVLPVGFFRRPIGGGLLGRYADKHGRRAALSASVLLMCAGSLLIAVTPGYASIGVAAPALLVFARLLQGISVGGEYGASATYLSEMAGAKHRGFWSSFQYVTLIMGQLLALGVLLVLQRTLASAQLDAWGWGIPFVFGAAGAVVAFYLRRSLEESSAFVTARALAPHAAPAPSGMAALRAHPRAVLTVIGPTAGGTVAVYTFTTYAQKFPGNTAGFRKADATLASALSLALLRFVHAVVAEESDGVGTRARPVGPRHKPPR